MELRGPRRAITLQWRWWGNGRQTVSDVVLPSNGPNIDGENVKGDALSDTFSQTRRTG